jgi:hypothetical protein
VKKEMSKVKMSALFFMIILTVTASTTIVSAASIKRIKFNALASGPCAVVYGLGTRGTSPIPDQEIWYWGEGMGNTRISGKARELELVELTVPAWGEGYESTKSNALGYVSVSWTDWDGENNFLVVVIHSSASTYGFFKLNELLSMPLPEVAPTPEYKELLSFTAIHVIGSEINVIQGFALYAIIPLTLAGWEDPGYLYGVGLVIPLEGDDQIMYQLMWSSSVNNVGGIPLADVIEWNVEEG